MCPNRAVSGNNGPLSLHSRVDATWVLFGIVIVTGLMALIFLQTGAVVMI